MSYVEALYNDLRRRLDDEARARRRLETAADVAGIASGFVVSTLAEAPLAADGQVAYAMRIISDGRKDGEGAGNGTGVVAMYDPTTDAWLRTSDYTAVVT